MNHQVMNKPLRIMTDEKNRQPNIEVVKLMVNRIDMSALADLYKVTKDRRI